MFIIDLISGRQKGFFFLFNFSDYISPKLYSCLNQGQKVVEGLGKILR